VYAAREVETHGGLLLCPGQRGHRGGCRALVCPRGPVVAAGREEHLRVEEWRGRPVSFPGERQELTMLRQGGARVLRRVVRDHQIRVARASERREQLDLRGCRGSWQYRHRRSEPERGPRRQQGQERL